MQLTFSTIRWASVRLSSHCSQLGWLEPLGWSYSRRSQVGSLSPVSLYSNELHLRSLAFLRKPMVLLAIQLRSDCRVEYADMIYLLIGSSGSLVRATYQSASSCSIIRYAHRQPEISWQVLTEWQRRSMGFRHFAVAASCHLRWLKASWVPRPGPCLGFRRMTRYVHQVAKFSCACAAAGL